MEKILKTALVIAFFVTIFYYIKQTRDQTTALRTEVALIRRDIAKVDAKANSLLTLSPKIDDPTDSYIKYTFIHGMLKKEKIPEEMQLGDYWYWLYFDKPTIVEDAYYGNKYDTKIQVYPPLQTDLTRISDFENKQVELYGYWTGGYAESTVFQIEAITKIYE